MPDQPSLPDAETVVAWTRLIRAQRRTLAAVQRALTDAHLPPLEWYDVLLELDKGGPMRIRDLQASLLLAQYNLSRLLDRMEGHKVLRRAACLDDRRGQLVSITTAGKALRRKMWSVYGPAIQREVGDRLSAVQSKQLTTLLTRLAS